MQNPVASHALEVDISGLFQALFMRMEDGAALHQMVFDDTGRPTNYRVVEVNSQYERFAGRKRDQLVGKLADDAYQESEPPHLEVYGRVALEGEPKRFDEYRETLGRHFEVSVAAMGSGYFSTVLTDVTERRLQQIALREGEWFLERSQIVGRLGSYRLQVSSGTWVSSRSLDDLFGIASDFDKDIAGWLGLVHPHDQESISRYMMEEVIDRGQPFDRRYRILRHGDGALCWVHMRGELEKDEAGVALYLIGTIQDITESVQKEQALENKFSELDRIFSLTLEMLSIATTDGRLLRVNAAWQRVLGWSVAELEGSQYLDLIHPADLASTQRAMEQLASGHDLIDFTNRYRCKDGSYRFLEWRSAPAGDVIYAGARDVSERERNRAERHRLEQQSMQSQKMESVGLLAGGVAHDFNNLLTVILACTDELMRRLVRDEASTTLLTEVDHAGRRAAELTRQLLAFSRQQVLRPRVVDLNEVVAGVLKMLGRMLGETIQIVWRPSAAVDPIFADPGQLEQVIVNLAVNARDAMPEGGRLRLETSNRSAVAPSDELSELVHRDYVVLAVHDTGVGMDEATCARIFEPFFTTKGELGTGLGLSTVYGIVKQSGGQVTVTSQPGLGTTFEIYLPITATAARFQSGIISSGRHTGHETVLLVEDEPPVRRILKKVLIGAGYRVLEAANADEALRASAAHRGRVDALLTDVVMPGKTGRQLAEQLLLERPSLRVIYMSGYTPSAALGSAGLEEEGSAFLQKPLRSAQLLSKLREVLDRCPARSA